MSDQNDKTIAVTETDTAIVLPRSRSAKAALVIGIIGLFTYPLGILSIMAIIFALKALGPIREGLATGRGMSVAGIILGSLGLTMTILMWAYIISTNALTTPTLASPEVNPEGIRYLRNRTAILEDYVRRAGGKKVNKAQISSYSSTTGNREDSFNIYDRKGLQTAPGFKIGINASARRQGNASVREIQGNLLMVSKSLIAPPLPVAERLNLRQGYSKSPSSLGFQIPQAYAAEAAPKVYKTAYPQGLQIQVERNRVKITGGWLGSTRGEYTFEGLNVQRVIEEVQAKQVPAPDEKMIKEKCTGATSVANAHIFNTLWDIQKETGKKGQTISKNKAVSLGVHKTADYNCVTKQHNLYLSIDFQGQIDGKEFEGLVYYPIPPSLMDMAQIEANMKENYGTTGRQLTTLQCEGKRQVSYKDSPIKCKGVDSAGNTTTAVITVNDASYSYVWGPVIPPDPDMAEIKKAISDNYAQTGRRLANLKCPRTGRVSYKDSPIKCDANDSEDGILEFVITIRKNKTYGWAWKRSLPEKPAPTFIQPPPRKQADIISIECPPGSEVIEKTATACLASPKAPVYALNRAPTGIFALNIRSQCTVLMILLIVITLITRPVRLRTIPVQPGRVLVTARKSSPADLLFRSHG